VQDLAAGDAGIGEGFSAAAAEEVAQLPQFAV
jgi:hypothetical protein